MRRKPFIFARRGKGLIDIDNVGYRVCGAEICRGKGPPKEKAVLWHLMAL